MPTGMKILAGGIRVTSMSRARAYEPSPQQHFSILEVIYAKINAKTYPFEKNREMKGK